MSSVASFNNWKMASNLWKNVRCDLICTNPSNFSSLETVGRGNETQI